MKIHLNKIQHIISSVINIWYSADSCEQSLTAGMHLVTHKGSAVAAWLRAKHKHWASVTKYMTHKYVHFKCTYAGYEFTYLNTCLRVSHKPHNVKCVGYRDISLVNLGILAQVGTMILDPRVLSTVLCTCPVICLLSDWQAGCYSV